MECHGKSLVDERGIPLRFQAPSGKLSGPTRKPLRGFLAAEDAAAGPSEVVAGRFVGAMVCCCESKRGVMALVVFEGCRSRGSAEARERLAV